VGVGFGALRSFVWKGYHLDIILVEHHDAHMRTTLTLDDDVARRLESEMQRSGEGMKAVVNRALRLGLGMADKPVEPEPFSVEAHAFGFREGTDLDRLNQLVDELEAEEVRVKLGGQTSGAPSESDVGPGT
jgi:hypothetical protein